MSPALEQQRPVAVVLIEAAKINQILALGKAEEPFLREAAGGDIPHPGLAHLIPGIPPDSRIGLRIAMIPVKAANEEFVLIAKRFRHVGHGAQRPAIPVAREIAAHQNQDFPHRPASFSFSTILASTKNRYQ